MNYLNLLLDLEENPSFRHSLPELPELTQPRTKEKKSASITTDKAARTDKTQTLRPKALGDVPEQLTEVNAEKKIRGVNSETGNHSQKALEARELGAMAQESSSVNWRTLSGAACSRAVHRERLRFWDVISEAGNGRLPEADGLRVGSTVKEANHILLYFTEIITEERRQFTAEEAEEIESVLSFLDYATSGLIPTDKGGFDWIEPEALADRTESECRAWSEQQREQVCKQQRASPVSST